MLKILLIAVTALLPVSPALALEWLAVRDPLNVEQKAPQDFKRFSTQQDHLRNAETRCNELSSLSKPLEVQELIALALCNNASTRLSWLGALSQANSLGEAESAYLPKADANLSLARSFDRSSGNSRYSKTASASIGATYTLFDFGKRDRAIETALRSVMIANYSHDSTMQDLILSTLTSYFSYVTAQAAHASNQQAFEAAQATYRAAKLRYELGLTPRNDMLQAESAYLQAQIGLQESERRIETARGQLANRLSLPPQNPLEVAKAPVSLHHDVLSASVEEAMRLAKERRPDLATARLSLENAHTSLKSARLQDLPDVTLSTTRSYSELGTRKHVTDGTIGVSVNIPLFTGFARGYSIRQAELAVQSSEESLRQAEENAMLEVWQSYQEYRNAAGRLQISEALVKSAEEAWRMALGRYKEGVGQILEVLTTQAAFSNARLELQQTELAFYTSGLELIKATGELDSQVILPNLASAQ